MYRLLNYRTVLLLCCILFFYTGCSRNRNGVIPPKEFENLLIDMHRTDAILSVNQGGGAAHELKNYEYYNSLFEKYGITRAQFDSSIVYYNARNKQFSQMYDRVLDSLNKELSIAEQELLTLRVNDSIDYYPFPDTLFFTKDSLYTRIVVDSLASGLYTFSTKIKFDSIDGGKNNRIYAYFLNEDKTDTLKVYNVHVMNDSIQRTYRWQQYIDSTFTRLEMSFVMSDNIKKLKTRSGFAINAHLYKPYIFSRQRKQYEMEMERRKEYMERISKKKK